MKGGKRPLGYTIIEVMIVLAISGIMFLIATVFVSGKQQRTQFTAGVNQMASNIQDVIEQVTDGQYSDVPIDCSGALMPQHPPAISAGGQGQGTNYGCVFLGKFISFVKSPPISNYDYEVFSLAGNRLTSSGQPAVLLSDIRPTPILSNVDLTLRTIMPQALSFKDIKVGTSMTTAYGFGFIQSQGALSSGTYVSGAQTIELVYAPNLSSGPNFDNVVASQLTGTAASNLVPINSATLCLTDGSRYATIDVGASSGNQLTATVTFKGTTIC